MPTKERLKWESIKRGERDVQFAPIDCAYVMSNAKFKAQSPTGQLLEILAWTMCYWRRKDTLNPEEVAAIKRQAGVDRAATWRVVSGKLASDGRWQLNGDGSVTVLRIKDKRPTLWNGKLENGANKGHKRAVSESISHREGKAALSGASCPPLHDDEEEPPPKPRPTQSVAENLKRILAENKAAANA